LKVIQETENLLIPYKGTAEAVNKTVIGSPGRDLEFLAIKGVGYTLVLDALRQFWLDWIEERLGGELLR